MKREAGAEALYERFLQAGQLEESEGLEEPLPLLHILQLAARQHVLRREGEDFAFEVLDLHSHRLRLRLPLFWGVQALLPGVLVLLRLAHDAAQAIKLNGLLQRVDQDLLARAGQGWWGSGQRHPLVRSHPVTKGHPRAFLI